ncbi:hypothetical protein FHX59_002446 [Paraburkholderia silvatlantica]|uniref:Uncharacterized protein n=1 Tax=Paraburkholderia silvatlantica TaxID=321895 RepID=A0ABR6FKR2_9BURK|nr:hypothetical protein [Paraburkholderia silvatlantica]
MRAGNSSGCVDQFFNMVGMGVCEQDRVDLGWFDTGKR